MSADVLLGPGLALWVLAGLVLAWRRAATGTKGTGLVYTHLLGLATLHWFPALLYVMPWTDLRNVTLVAAGLNQSVVAACAFVAGSVLVVPFLERVVMVAPATGPRVEPVDLGPLYIGLGVVFYALRSVSALALPTLSAILATGQSVLVVGLCLMVWKAWVNGRPRRVAALLAAALCLPFVTIVNSGFMGYGAVATLVVIAFFTSLVRPRPAVLVGWLALVYLGLSFYVGYMRDRTEIRDAVWGGSSLEVRLGRMADTLAQFEGFDMGNPMHVAAVNGRLNQDIFIGIATERLRLRVGEDYAWGGTFVEALLSLVPRALWPEKPVFGGSGDLMTRYTGIRFAEGTSIGIGQVMEFYVNFSTIGVALGFLAMGTALTLLDSTARRRLDRGDPEGFALAFVVGLAFLQAGGSLVEVAGSVGAGAVIVILINWAYRDLWVRQAPGPSHPAVRPVA